MNPLRAVAITALGVAVAVGGWFYYRYEQAHPSTSDAYVQMHVVRIVAQVSGPVQDLQVRSHQRVKAGELLFTIDPAPFQLAVTQAQAQLQLAQNQLQAADAKVSAAQAQIAAAQANLDEAKKHAERIRALRKQGTVPQDQADAAERALRDSQAALKAAKAEYAAALASRGDEGQLNAAVQAARARLGLAQLDLEHTRVSAPADGVLGEVDLRPGDYVVAGQALFPLVETGHVWVQANFKETDLPRIRPGQPASISVDMVPGRSFRGRVESISPASGTAFSLLPPENATGNWVKVTQRFPVRVQVLDPEPALRIGASVEVTIDTSQQGEAAR